MRKVTTALLALGMTTALSGAALACSWGKTAGKKSTLTTAEAPAPTEEAITTFDPAKVDQLLDESSEKTDGSDADKVVTE